MKIGAMLRVAGTAGLFGLDAACSSSLPAPPSGRVPDDALVEVPYPPPPARVQTVPPRETEKQVWIDGQWDWTGKVWRWSDGAWETPPPGAKYFTPWTTVRKPDGRLLFARATWRNPAGKPVPGTTSACAADPDEGAPAEPAGAPAGTAKAPADPARAPAETAQAPARPAEASK